MADHAAPLASASTAVELPAALNAVLERTGDVEAQARLRAVFEAASRAIGALGELDLSRFEADDEGEEAYQVWEEVAPVVRDTLAVTHGLLEAIDVHLPAAPAAPDGPIERSILVIRETAAGLRAAFQAFRAGMQKPEHVANRWDVLRYLAAFRGRTRAEIGDVIFAAAGCFGPVDKAEVVPCYREDLEQALALRRGLARLAREVAILGSQIELAADEGDLRYNAALLLERLRAFTAASPYRQLRVDDRRLFVHVLAVLEADAPQVEIAAATSDLFDFLKALSVNRREMLVRHDEVAASLAGDHVARARAAIEEGVRRARVAFSEAVGQLARLEGRDSSVDGIIDEYRALDPDELGAEQLIGHLAVLEGVANRFGERGPAGG